MSAVARFLRTATGPARLRDDLRRRTRPLAALLAATRTSRPLAANLPRSVLGGDLVDLLGRRFELAMLWGEEEAAAVEGRPAGSGLRGWIGGDPRAGAPRPWSSAGVSPVPSGGGDGAGLASPGRRRAPFSPAAQAPAPTGPPLERFPASGSSPPARGRVADSGAPSPPGRRRVPLPSPAPAPPAPPPWSPTSALEGALAEYRRLSEAGPIAAGGSASPSPAASPPRLRSSRSLPSPGRSSPAAVARSPASWPELTGRQVAQKLRRAAAPGGPGSRRETSLTAAGEGVEIHNVFNIEVAGEDRGESPDDLADRLADVLRLQAQQHGIDIT